MKSTWKNAPFYICVKSSVIAYRKKTRFSHLPASAGTRVCLRVRSFALTLHKCETHTEWERRERESEQKHYIHREYEKHQQWVRAHFLCTLSHSNELLAFKINICFFRFIFPFLIHFFLCEAAAAAAVPLCVYAHSYGVCVLFHVYLSSFAWASVLLWSLMAVEFCVSRFVHLRYVELTKIHARLHSIPLWCIYICHT